MLMSDVPFLPACRAVDAVCREGPARVLELVKMGADFTRNAGERVSVQCGQTAALILSSAWFLGLC